MAAKIPQDVTREDRLIGPLTLKQFLYVLGGAALVFIAYQYYTRKYLYFTEFVLISLVAVALSVSLAFIQINGRPFGLFALQLWHFWTSPKQAVWHKEPRQLVQAIKVQASDIKDTKSEVRERQSGGELKTQLEKLSHLLDTGGTMRAEDQDAVTTQINNLNPNRSSVSEAGLDVEDILTDTD